jgi:hypothetical protein
MKDKGGWQDELFAQNGFFSLYLAARKHVGVLSTTVVVIVTFFVSVVPILLGIGGYWSPLWTNDVASGIRIVTTLGVNFATSILGFLVSGFALFFAITRSDVLKLLGEFKGEKTRISHLQTILFSFMYVFLHYIIYIAWCMAILTMFAPGAILTTTMHYWHQYYPLVIKVAATIAFGVSTSWLALILLLLKTFIWNLYQTVLIAITVGVDVDIGRLKHLLDPGQRGTTGPGGGA